LLGLFKIRAFGTFPETLMPGNPVFATITCCFPLYLILENMVRSTEGRPPNLLTKKLNTPCRICELRIVGFLVLILTNFMNSQESESLVLFLASSAAAPLVLFGKLDPVDGSAGSHNANAKAIQNGTFTYI